MNYNGGKDGLNMLVLEPSQGGDVRWRGGENDDVCRRGAAAEEVGEQAVSYVLDSLTNNGHVCLSLDFSS